MSKFYIRISENHKFYANKIKEKVDNQKKIIEDYKKECKYSYTHLEANEKDYLNSLNKLKNLRDEYHEIARLTERSFLEKYKSDLNRYSNVYEKDDYKIRVEKMKIDFLKSEKNYFSFLSIVNQKRENYIKVKAAYLQGMQKIENSLNQFIKETLFQLNVDLDICYEDIKCDNKTLKNVNDEADLMNFINKNQSKYEPPFPIEFDFYNIICRRDPPKDADLRAIHYTITSMQNTLTYKDENNLYNTEEEEKRVLIAELSTKVWYNSEKFNDNDFLEINKLFKDKKHRIYFLEYLNKHRGSGLHILSSECFKKIGLILNLLLEEVNVSNDFITAKYCLILSQTYNKQDEMTNKKISLQDTIEKHELFRNLYFWEQYISFVLIEELESSNLKQSHSYKESEEEKLNRFGNIFFSQLIHICYNMITFKIPKRDIKQIILTYSNQYNLPDYHEEQLVTMIDSSDYLDYIELEKKEKERIEFEKEFNRISGESIIKDSEKLNIEIKRSNSDNAHKNEIQKGDNLDVSQTLKNLNENDFEIINESEISDNNNVKKNRSFSLNENYKSVNKIYNSEDQEKKKSFDKNSIPDHYILNEVKRNEEKESDLISYDYKNDSNLSKEKINMIDDFYSSSEKNKPENKDKHNEIETTQLMNDVKEKLVDELIISHNGVNSDENLKNEKRTEDKSSFLFKIDSEINKDNESCLKQIINKNENLDSDFNSEKICENKSGNLETSGMNDFLVNELLINPEISYDCQILKTKDNENPEEISMQENLNDLNSDKVKYDVYFNKNDDNCILENDKAHEIKLDTAISTIDIQNKKFIEKELNQEESIDDENLI